MRSSKMMEEETPWDIEAEARRAESAQAARIEKENHPLAGITGREVESEPLRKGELAADDAGFRDIGFVCRATGTEAEVCADIASRQEESVPKYGTTVADNPAELREWLQHAYEEALDQAIYLKRAIREIENNFPTSGER